MKRSSYGERNYAFGQAMLTLRTSIGLTQAELAEYLGVSRQAVGDWEAGSSYPKANHLKHFIVLCAQQQAFPAGREAEEVRAFWKAARQKLRLDEPWLSALLSQQPPRSAPRPVEETRGTDHVSTPGNCAECSNENPGLRAIASNIQRKKIELNVRTHFQCRASFHATGHFSEEKR